MSDISIPGFSNQNSTINTDRVIEDLLELERIPIDRIESKIDEYQLEREAWFDIGRRVTQLSDNASFLFSFQNPFNDRIGVSSDNQALTLTPVRRAEEAEHTIKIVQNAGRDRFQSQPIERDYQVSSGKYTFAVGDETVTTNFNGGSLRDFSDEINLTNPDVLTTRVIKTANDASTIVFEAQKYGKDNPLSFQDDALLFAQEHGIIIYKKAQKFQDDSEYVIPEQSEERIALTEQIAPDSSLTLSFTALLEDTSPASDTAAKFQLPSSGSITLENVTVPNIRSNVPIADSEPIVVDNSHPTFLYAILSDDTEVPIADITGSNEPQQAEVPLDAISSPITALILRNSNTHQTLTISDIGIRATSQDDYEPLNSIQQARDAILKIDDIEVTRSSNIIDDLIPQTTIELLAEESATLKVEITPDYENIKNSVIRFVGSYNQLIRELNILSRSNSEIIDELEFLTDDERLQAQERLGLMRGETSLSQLRARLINFTQNPYPTSAGREINLLSQIGIATNVGGFNNSNVSRSRLRGYLELDEAQFDTVLQEQFQAVRELFGNDTDRDLVTDSGLAYEIDRYSNLYTQNGGIVQIRTNGIDGRIERSNEQLVNYNQKIEDYERKLRVEFGRMQGALNSLDATTQSLERLQTQ